MTTRAPKKRPKFSLRPIDIIVFTVAIILIIFGVWATLNAPKDPCPQPGKEHTVTLNADAFSQSQLTVTRCDIIKIANLDPAQNYELAFGVHPNHVAYPGFSEQMLRPNEFIVIDTIKTGTFRLHDALRDKAALDLTIIGVGPN